jgi:hypothetical protein
MSLSDGFTETTYWIHLWFHSLCWRCCWSASSSMALEVWPTTGPHQRGFHFLLGCFSVFFIMVRRQLHPEVRIRPFPPYTRFGGVSSDGTGRVESCVRWMIGSRVHLCGMLVSSNLHVVVTIGDGCCSSALIFEILTTSRMYTTTSSTTIIFVRLRWWRGEDSGTTSACASIYL